MAAKTFWLNIQTFNDQKKICHIIPWWFIGGDDGGNGVEGDWGGDTEGIWSVLFWLKFAP